MNTKMKKSYAEVRAILDLLGNTYKEKIPEKLLELFYFDSEYVIEFDENIPIEEISITREALVIISILNLKYFGGTDLWSVMRMKRAVSMSAPMFTPISWAPRPSTALVSRVWLPAA